MKIIRQTTLKDYFCIIIGSAFGLGLAPIAPGTSGTLLGVLIHILTVNFLPVSIHLATLIIFFILVCAANNLLTPWAEKYWESPDPKHFVLDEVAGYLLVPIIFRHGQLWKVVLWGFFLFRIFDILKLIPPAKQIDKNMHGAWGILLDDLVSGTYAGLTLILMDWIGPHWLLNSL